MSLNRLSLDSFIVNGESFRAFNLDGIKHPVAPIEQLVPFSVYDLEADKVKEFDLSKFTMSDLMVVSFRASVQADNTLNTIETGTISLKPSNNVTLQIIEQGIVAEQIDLRISSYPTTFINPFVLSHKQTYRIQSSENINRLTFFCKIIHLLPAINIVVPSQE